MSDNYCTIVTSDNVEIYENRIMELADDYLATLKNPDLIYTKSAVFSGLINYIYIKMFKPNFKNGLTNTNLDITDIETLDNIWSVYGNLCSIFNKRKTILKFCNMIGISRDTINEWKNGTSRSKVNGKPSTIYSDTAKKWLAECESDLFDGAIEESSIGCIFGLKSCYGYQEQNKVVIENTAGLQTQSLEQIAQQFQGTELPPPIEIE